MKNWALIPLLFTQIAWAQNSKTIIGGEPVATNDPIAQFSVAIDITYNGQKGYCSGVIVTPTIIMTAGHCVLGKMMVHFGINADQPVKIIRAIKAIRPPAYIDQWPQRDDIALVTLQYPIPTGFKPIALPHEPIDLYNGTVLETSGYGSEHDGLLYKTKMKILNTENPTDTILADRVDPNSGLYFGDSGGPLFVKHKGVYTLVALTQAGVKDGLNGEVHLTNIFSQIPWLYKNGLITLKH